MIGKPRIARRELLAIDSELPASLHPVLQRIYRARGVHSAADIEHRLASMLAPQQLGGIDRACELIAGALRDDKPILIVGDFDADGATGTAVAIRGLRLLGAKRVDYGVPNRFVHGYGLSAPLVDELLARRPELRDGGVLITVDNGVASHAGVAAARVHGMKVIVTDHHLPGATLPDADAIVNPNLAGDAFPSKSLAGVGVMFYLLLALRAYLREREWFVSSEKCGDGSPPGDSRDQDERKNKLPDLSSLLDLIALGTVADLVPLDRNNRILVEAGLKRIRSGRACPGIVALLESGKRDPVRAVASDLGFVVGPRINAAGRLEDIRIGIECLLTDDLARARTLAETLSAINAERRGLQAGMVEQAQAAVQKWILQHGREALPTGLVLFEPDWHHGVVGLVASKLKETLNRPVIACAPALVEEREQGSSLRDSRAQDARINASEEVKASGRSIAGFHLRDALAEIDARVPGLLQRFGGHAMAAGMTLRRADVARLAQEFDAVARAHLAPAQLDAILYTDGELDGADFSVAFADALRYAGPWGQAFPEPLFDGEFAIESARVVGENHWRLKLRCARSGKLLDAMQFQAEVVTPLPPRIRAAFQLDVNEWNGEYSLRLLLRHIEEA